MLRKFPLFSNCTGNKFNNQGLKTSMEMSFVVKNFLFRLHDKKTQLIIAAFQMYDGKCITMID